MVHLGLQLRKLETSGFFLYNHLRSARYVSHVCQDMVLENSVDPTISYTPNC